MMYVNVVRKGSKWKWKVQETLSWSNTLFALKYSMCFFFHLSFVRTFHPHPRPQSFNIAFSPSLLFHVSLPASRFSFYRYHFSRLSPRHSSTFVLAFSLSLSLSLNNNNWIWIRKITLYRRQQSITMYIIYTGNRVVCLFHTILLYSPVI